MAMEIETLEKARRTVEEEHQARLPLPLPLGALVVLGLLTLLAGPRRLREPLSLLVGLAVCS